MDNLQKLYQTVFEAGLINNSFDDFSKAMSSEDYQKKVFDVITQQGFFSQDFNAFKSAYSNRALRDVRPGEAGYEQFGKKSQQINPALISEEDLTLAEQLTNATIGNLSPTWQNYLDMFVVGSSDVIQNLFGDEAAYNFLSDVAVGEFAESYLSFGPFNSRHSKKAYRVKSYYDTNTNELVKFDEEAYDRDGLDAIENNKYFSLAKQYKEKKSGVKLFDARTNKPFEETYAAEVDAQMAVINKRFSELNPVTDPGVTGFTDAIKKGELDDALATAASFITDMSAQMVAARATKGKSMAAIMYGNSWKTYNDEKSKALYGEDDPDRVKKLIESGQENTAIPATLGAVGYALERFGMEQITTAMLRKASKGAGTTVMKAMAVEGGTEYLQALVEKFNKSLGEQKSAVEASQDVADYMFTEEAADAFFAGIIGGGTLSAGGQAVQAAFRRDETSNQFVNQKLKDLAKLDEYRARTFDKKQRKQYDKAMKQTVEEIKNHLKRNKKVSDYLDQNQIDSLVDILDQNTNTKKEIDNVIKLFNKGLISANEFTAEKAILEKKEAEQKEAINKIKNDANMSLVMQDLDASGKLIKDLKILEQRVFKTEAEFLEALKEEYLAQGKTEKEFKADTEGYSIDGLKVGNVLFVNAQVAAEKNRFGTGTHELLHGVLKATLQSKDGTGNLSTEGERIVQDFINSLSSRELNIIEQQLEDGSYKVNKDGTEKEFKEYGEEYLNFYAQGAKENAFTLNAVEKAGKKIASIFNSKTDFKKIGFEDGNQVKNFLNAFAADSKKGIYRQEFVEMAKEGEQVEDAVIKKSANKLSEKAEEIQAEADAIGKKAKNKAEYDAGINVEAYDFYVGKDGKQGALDTLIKAKLARPKKNKEGKIIFEGISNLDSPDANVSGVRLADYVESVKEKMIPEILGFNPDKETTTEGKFGLSGHVNFRLDKRMGDVLDSAKKTVTGKSLDAPIDDSGRTAADFVESEADSRLARLEEENLGFLYVNAENRLQETEEDKNVLKSRYRHKLKNNDGSKLIGETQVESIREGVRTALRKLKDDVTSDKFLLNFENMVKKTMKNIVQSAIGTKATYRQFVLNNFENIIDFSTVQDLVAMERLVGKGKLKDGKKIFTVPIKRLTKQEDIQKAIDQSKLPVDAINKSEEGVFLSEKRMPSKEELEAFFFGVNMQEVLGYELGASTLGTRKDGLSRMIVTELAQDATMETVQESAIAEEILSTSPDLTIDVITRSVAVKINRSPDLKFSKSLDEIMNDNTQLPDIRKGAEVLIKKGYQSPEWIKFMNDSKVENKIKLELTINYLQRNSENWYLVKKIKGMPARLKKMKGKTHEKFEKIAQQVLADILRPEGYSVGHLTEKNNAPDVRIYRPNNSKFEIGVEVKGTTSRGSMKSFNSKKGKGFERDNTTDDFYSDNAKQKVDKLLEKANKQVDKIYQFLGVKREYNDNNNLLITQDQKKKIKEKGLHLNKNFVEFITTLDFETMYLNKKGKSGVVRPSHYLQLGVAGLFQMGKLNPLNIVDIKRFADQNVDIPITVRFDFSKPLTDGRVRLHVKVEPQLDSRFFKAQNINLFNLDSPNLKVSYSKSVKLGVAENIVKASDNARLASYSKTKKGASIFDFDETVGVSENFIIATKEDVTKKISSEEWPFVGEDLANQGYKFDFTDFNRVTKGKPGPLLPKMKNQIKKYGPKNVFILTARAPESQQAIHDWLKSEGINIPIENITGLGNSTGEAKAMWVLDKYANEGYNDMYFVDDAITNVQAVQNVFDQLDIKGKSVQAKIDFSRTKKQSFDAIIKRTVGADKDIDPARARIIGAKKGSREFFIAPGADDFQGLMMRLAGEGKQGESDMKFFKQVFFDPFNRAYRKLNSIQYNMMESYKQIRKDHKNVIKKLKKNFDNEFTNEDAIRVYLWHQQDLDVPGLTANERKDIANKIAEDADMVEYALKVRDSLQTKDKQYTPPKEHWIAGSIKGDMYEALNKLHRDNALQEWQENVNELLNNEAQMAKLEATMGSDYVEALKDILYRMRTGKNRPSGQSAATNKVLNWLQGSVGAIMFFNMRSAVLQTISTVNFINHTDNNVFAFAKAIGNVKQFAEDFKTLFNSPQLKVRRSGLQQDIQTADLADSLSRGGAASNALAYLLKIGFTPTQIADSFAIAFGGATFYRNRLNTYLNQGMTQDQAESQAMIDFQEITEESQQSSRPDRISKQQASTAGRLLLAFQNTPLQYNRIIKKAVSDIANNRGDKKTHISRIAYYGAAQALIFYALQQALFIEDEPEEEQVPGSVKREYNAGVKNGSINRVEYPNVGFYYADVKNKQKKESLVNSMADGWLRGSGVKGALVSTFKNVIRSFMKESEKGYKADYFNTFVEVLNVSPQIGSKARKIKRASDTYKYNKEVMSEIGAFDIDNPVYPMTTSLIEGATNAPVHRIYTKLDNLKEAFNEDNTAMQRVFVALGWNQWQLGIDTYKDVREAKDKIKEEKKAKKKQCRRILSSGKRCSIRTTNKSQLCYHHD